MDTHALDKDNEGVSSYLILKESFMAEMEFQELFIARNICDWGVGERKCVPVIMLGDLLIANFLCARLECFMHTVTPQYPWGIGSRTPVETTFVNV